MWNRLVIVLSLIAICQTTYASITLAVDKLDASDGLPLPPAHIVVVDVFVDLSENDAWTGALINGTAHSGAELEFLTQDPNSVPVFTAPGLDQRFVSFVSRPRGRNADERFTEAGAAGVEGLPIGPPVPILTSATFRLTSYHPATPPPVVGLDGYIMRIALDLTNVSDPAFRTDSTDIIVASTPPPGAILLFDCSGPAPYGGISAIGTSFEEAHIAWGVYGVPEPSALLLAILIAPALRRCARLSRKA